MPKIFIKYKNTQKGPIFANTYDPRLRPIVQIQTSHWRTMVHRNSSLAEVFARTPPTGYISLSNIRKCIIRIKIYIFKKNIIIIKVIKKCGKRCPACSYIIEGKVENGVENEKKHMIVIHMMLLMQLTARNRNVQKHILEKLKKC